MGVGTVVLAGDFHLSGALIDQAGRHGIRLHRSASDRPPALIVDDVPHELPDAAECGRLVVERALATLVDAVTPAPVGITATVLAPAAGRCVPGAAGPVDAVRVGELYAATVGHAAVTAAVRTLVTQQTRCWLISAEVTGEVRVGPALPVLPSAACMDTALATQYQLDRGLGFHWAGVVLMGAPVAAGDSTHLLAMCTDGVLAADLLAVAGAMRGAS
jgi:hypothetical protein